MDSAGGQLADLDHIDSLLPNDKLKHGKKNNFKLMRI
jgi:hypothetical protein